MKRTITIFLLLLLCLNSIGLYPIFKLIQFHTKELAENIIRQQHPGDLVVFMELHKNKEVIWEEENKEFLYRGKMYDVAKVEEEEGNLLYYCYDDKKESAISNRIDALVNNQLSNDKNPGTNAMLHLMMLLSQSFIPGEPYSFEPKFINGNVKPTDRFFSTNYPVCVIDIPLPPPWHSHLC